MAEKDIQELIKFDNQGLSVASFVEIKNAIINRYKLAYGKDIDLAETNGDGIFVNDLALIMNNILQTMSVLYKNLNVDTASGTYLDILCGLSNVTRKGATASRCSLTITNSGVTSITILAGQYLLLDISNNEWTWKVDSTFTLDAGDTVSVVVYCNTLGPISAVAGSINKFAVLDSITESLSITQSEDAIIGTNQESDSALRARRAQSNGAVGNTVLESLVGALLEINGIDDVYIYNNDTGSNATLADSAVVASHDVYIVVRQTPNVAISNATIGETIYNKLTPGIKTSNGGTGTITGGTIVDYEYTPIISGQAFSSSRDVYWKNATAANVSLTITIKKFANYSTSTDELIKAAVKEYCDTLPIGLNSEGKLNEAELSMTAMSADPLYNGRPTYYVTSISGIPTTANALTYLNATITITYAS